MAKKYRVEISSLAEQDVLAIRDYIARDKPRAAAQWVRSFKQQAKSLARFPERHEMIPEAARISLPYRHILYGSYRTIYRIDVGRVVIVRVIHAARTVDRVAMLDPDR